MYSNKRKYILIVFFVLLATTFLLSALLFIGIYEEVEFSEKYLFVKHRPSLKFYFDSPLVIGENRSFESLSESEKLKQKFYDEFVLEKGGYKRSFYIGL